MLVGGVPVGDDKSLMSFEAQVPQGGVDDLLPLLPGEVLIRGERDREVLDGLVGASQGGGGAHDEGRLLRVLQDQFASGGPQHAVRIGIVLLAL